MKKYEQIMKEQDAEEWQDLEDGLFPLMELKTDNISIKKEEELTVHVLNDEQILRCNLCGKEHKNTLCLHLMKNYQFKQSEKWDTIEEELIFCESCTRKLAALYDEV